MVKFAFPRIILAVLSGSGTSLGKRETRREVRGGKSASSDRNGGISSEISEAVKASRNRQIRGGKLGRGMGLGWCPASLLGVLGEPSRAGTKESC